MTKLRFMPLIISLSMSIGILFAADYEYQLNEETQNKTTNGLTFWEGDWVNGEDNGIFPGLASKGYTAETDMGFIVHTVGDPSKPLIYSYYLIPDLHIGDLGVATFPNLDSQEDPDNIYADYNLPGWKPNLDLKPAVQEEGIWRPAGILPLPMP